jgi:hypothetical protein
MIRGMAYEISETPIAYGWPDYQVPEEVLSIVNNRVSPPQSVPEQLQPASSVAPQAPLWRQGSEIYQDMGFWILVMLFILQLAVIGIVADLHIQQRNLLNILMMNLGGKNYGMSANRIK